MTKGVILSVLSLFLIGLVGLFFLPAFSDAMGLPVINGHAYDAGMGDPTATLTPTATQQFCPTGTPPPILVDPVDSPTTAFTQTVNINMPSATFYTVTLETGVFVDTDGSVIVDLAPNQLHHLTASGGIPLVINPNGCPSGGFSLSTTVDKFGDPLIILQAGNHIYFPQEIKGQP